MSMTSARSNRTRPPRVKTHLERFSATRRHRGHAPPDRARRLPFRGPGQAREPLHSKTVKTWSTVESNDRETLLAHCWVHEERGHRQVDGHSKATRREMHSGTGDDADVRAMTGASARLEVRCA